MISAAMAGRNFSGMGPILMIVIPLYILMLLIVLMQIIGMTEEALGTRKGSPFFYFNVGRPVWLLAATLLLFMLLFFGMAIVAPIAALALAFLGGLAGSMGRGIVVVIGTIVIYGG